MITIHCTYFPQSYCLIIPFLNWGVGGWGGLVKAMLPAGIKSQLSIKRTPFGGYIQNSSTSHMVAHNWGGWLTSRGKESRLVDKKCISYISLREVCLAFRKAFFYLINYWSSWSLFTLLTFNLLLLSLLPPYSVIFHCVTLTSMTSFITFNCLPFSLTNVFCPSMHLSGFVWMSACLLSSFYVLASLVRFFFVFPHFSRGIQCVKNESKWVKKKKSISCFVLSIIITSRLY